MRNSKQCFFITDQTSNPRIHDLEICPNFKGKIGYQGTCATKCLASST